eukprot:TRINITY_DN9703_c0_g1_i1.p1 TRINITY_DN9703_c0_g1~~TRINITY_DN9703_c0_g1_i1.p1  ORF type:complete len:473 (-),score=121.08 TRINITY_DN9703_c0_g1_i1:56-1474(-)
MLTSTSGDKNKERPYFVQAVYAYAARREGVEMSLEVGHRYEVVGYDNRHVWLAGRADQGIRWFPASYVRRIREEPLNHSPGSADSPSTSRSSRFKSARSDYIAEAPVVHIPSVPSTPIARHPSPASLPVASPTSMRHSGGNRSPVSPLVPTSITFRSEDLGLLSPTGDGRTSVRASGEIKTKSLKQLEMKKRVSAPQLVKEPLERKIDVKKLAEEKKMTEEEVIYLRDLVHKRLLRHSVEIKDRKWLLKTVRVSFIGKELVDWFVANNVSPTREEAVLLGDRLMRCGFMMCCVGTSKKEVFHDDLLLYRFTKHHEKLLQEKIKQKKRKPTIQLNNTTPIKLNPAELAQEKKGPELITPFRALIQNSEKNRAPAKKQDKEKHEKRSKEKSSNILIASGVPPALATKSQIEKKRKLQKELTKLRKKREKQAKEQEARLIQNLHVILGKGEKFKEPPPMIPPRYLPLEIALPDIL